VLSAIFGFLIFQEFPTVSTLFGAAIIIPSTLYLAVFETRQQHKRVVRAELRTVAAGQA